MSKSTGIKPRVYCVEFANNESPVLGVVTIAVVVNRTNKPIVGRVMGGSSAINYLVYMRGNKRDYDDWAALGNYGWSYQEVLPYFIKSENNRNKDDVDEYYHGYEGPMTVEKFKYTDPNVVMLANAFEESGLPIIDVNGEDQIGAMIVQATARNGIRMSTNAAFIRPVRNKRLNLRIRTNAQVTKVLINPTKKIAYGVRYFRNGRWYRAHASKEVILSAGALNSPKILMLSGIGPRRQLRALGIKVLKNLKVGYNLHDHATTNAMLMSLTNKTSTQISAINIIREVKRYYSSKNKDGPLSATGPLYVTAFVRTPFADEDETVPDIQFHFDGRHLREFYSDPTTYLSTSIFPFSYYDSINVRPILLLPQSRGFLTLNTTHPVFGQPLIYPRFFTDQRDVDTLVAALKMVVELENTRAFKENGVEFVRCPVEACQAFQWGTDEYFFCLLTRYTGTIFHPSGTCKMGPESDKRAVVDPRLKVYGIRHLRVADASIMPNIVRGNTNAPVIMIGEKVSDMVKEDWSHYS
ncbi:glucose dehydrogenase [FAD, quinone]-like [Ostrinia nubilalis]|uniref:glucose dehydrogenase [FAD, quinone]-like n=1 Tax=Ostrinia nubilalis TaxID=29057 RepID=UPI0030822F23